MASVGVLSVGYVRVVCTAEVAIPCEVSTAAEAGSLRLERREPDRGPAVAGAVAVEHGKDVLEKRVWRLNISIVRTLRAHTLPRVAAALRRHRSPLVSRPDGTLTSDNRELGVPVSLDGLSDDATDAHCRRTCRSSKVEVFGRDGVLEVKRSAARVRQFKVRTHPDVATREHERDLGLVGAGEHVERRA